MKLPILYSFRRCPYAMRARMALYHSKINYEHREILLRNRPEKLYQLSPKGTVPVLELPSGDVIDESFDIMKWALSINDPEMWFDKHKEEQVDLIKLNDDKFKKWLDKYKYHVRFPEYPLEYYRKECEKILDIYEDRLKDKSFFFLALQYLWQILLSCLSFVNFLMWTLVILMTGSLFFQNGNKA